MRFPALAWIPALVALSLCGVATPSADENDLSGGVFICHFDPHCQPSGDPPPGGWCEYWLDDCAIHTCEEQNPSIMQGAVGVWYVLSAFAEDKTWCGSEFGFGQFDPYLFIFMAWGPCTPGQHLEIPSPGWPGPDAGTAIVTTDAPWTGNFQPVYYFIGYAYYATPGRIPFGIDPPTGFGGWGNCLTPPVSYSAACYPQMGVLMPGVVCCPEEEPEFACCVCQECYLASESECDDLGGEWHPEWDSCVPNPCPASPTSGATWGLIKTIYR